MNVLIGNAPWYRDGHYGVRAGSRWPHFERNDARYYPFPFFMGYAGSLLEQHGFDVRLLDGVVERMNEDAFLARVVAEEPDLIFLEVSTPSWETDRRVIRRIREACLRAPIVLGGIHAFMFDRDFFRSTPEVLATVRSEYEGALLDIATRLRDGRELAGIPGVTWRSGDEVDTGPDRPLLSDLDSLPRPHRSQLPMDRYIDGLLDLPQPCLQMWASRGCPHRCSFCAWPQIMYQPGTYRVRDPAHVVREMVEEGRDKGFASVYFDDDVFNVGDRRMMRLAELLRDAEWTSPWGMMARADTCSERVYEDLRRVGLVVAKFGVES
ncbi:MAG: cobalamin-dependent protein, partial [Candidatus Eisenbacteria bacterium]|nr:cobalamin-dependent protein [Candidatus Eisenbacteria bacterium]